MGFWVLVVNQEQTHLLVTRLLGGQGLPPGSLDDSHKEVGETGKGKESRHGQAGVLRKYGWTDGGPRPKEELECTTIWQKPRNGRRQKEESGKEKPRDV